MDQAQPTECYICKGAGPFSRGFVCTFKVEHVRHRYVTCSDKCTAKFEKECVRAAEAGLEVKVARKVIQKSKAGVLFCPKCFYELKDMKLENARAGSKDDADATPPPPPQTERKDSGVESCPSPVAAAAELDIELCVAHVKEKDDAVAEGLGKKTSSKATKKQARRERITDASGLTQALFKDPAASRVVTEDGELLGPDMLAPKPPSSLLAPSPALSQHAATPSVVVPVAFGALSAVPEWGPSKATSDWASKAAANGNGAASAPKAAAAGASANATRSEASAADEAIPVKVNFKGLPAGWHAAWDPSCEEHYFYNSNTGEVTWDRPCEDAAGGVDVQAQQARAQAEAEEERRQERREPTTGAPGLEEPGGEPYGEEYTCIRSWEPPSKEKDTCMRLLRGERVVLNGETNGWGRGYVVPEPVGPTRSGHFPRWALSDRPAPAPVRYAAGSRCVAKEEFVAPAGGYLSVKAGAIVEALHQVHPWVWVYAEETGHQRERGWLPEAILRSA